MTPKNKGGRKPGPQWTPASRLFVELMKKGETQTEAARQAWPRNKRPDVQAARAKRSPLVQAEMEQYQRVKQEEELARAKMAGRLMGISDVMDLKEKRKILAKIARSEGSKDKDRIGAIWTDAKLAGEIIDLHRELKDFEGRTVEELEYYADHGYWPQHDEPGAAPSESGSPPAGRVN